MREAGIPHASRGPAFEGDEADALALSVDIWSNSSLSLQYLADGHGFAYFHFLQPNQYVEGSKPFTTHEERMFRQRKEISASVSTWYPVLQERGAELARQGVRFFDLTQIFADQIGEIYKDTCCHFNRRGNKILGSTIGNTIVASLNDHPLRQ